MEPKFYTETKNGIIIDGFLMNQRIATELGMEKELVDLVLQKYDSLLEEAGIIVFDNAKEV